MMAREEVDRDDPSQVLMRELRSPHNTRFLGAMPVFKVENDTPDTFAKLLERMERREAEGARRGGGGGGGSIAVHNPER